MILPYSFFHQLRVRWAEVDRQGIVFNGHYLTYFDVAITEYWRAINLPYPDGVADSGSDLYVVKTLINYKGSAEYDDILDIGVHVSRIGLTMKRAINRQPIPPPRVNHQAEKP